MAITASSLSVDLVNALLCSKDFADTLQRVGGKAESILYEGRTHTDIFLQVKPKESFSSISFCTCGLAN